MNFGDFFFVLWFLRIIIGLVFVNDNMILWNMADGTRIVVCDALCFFAWSEFFRLDFGIRQGSVLSPLFFALYVDNIANISKLIPGIFVFMYADDILILSPIVSKLQELLNVIECELRALELTINSKKSCCLPIGPRCDVNCTIITNVTGVMITWVSELIFASDSC